MRFLIVIITFFLNANYVQSEENNPLGLNFYGSFLHTERVPNALFFFSEIKDNDSFELRKALRSHEVDTIVLSSRGGSVWEGLSMAGIIHDQRLKTYVPEQGLREAGNCASACSFMFFGGSTRIADGALGVHQFYSGAAKQNAQIGESQSNAQFTVSEIIGFLNEFDTPPFVFERMFQQKEMYYFNASELAQINSTANAIAAADITAINRFIRLFNAELERLRDEDRSAAGRISDAPKVAPNPAPKTTQPRVSDTAVIREVQSELNRLNCGAGRPDGVIGKRTRAALKRYANAIKRELPEYVLSSSAFLNVIRMSKIKCNSSLGSLTLTPSVTSIPKGILEGSWTLKEACQGESGYARHWSSKPKLKTLRRSNNIVTYSYSGSRVFSHDIASDTIEESYLKRNGKRVVTAVYKRLNKNGRAYLGKGSFYGMQCTYWFTKID